MEMAFANRKAREGLIFHSDGGGRRGGIARKSFGKPWKATMEQGR
jgi:hypothetical protein